VNIYRKADIYISFVDFVGWAYCKFSTCACAHRVTSPDCEDSFEPTTVEKSVGMAGKLGDRLEKQSGAQDFFWKCQTPSCQSTSSHLLIYLANFELFFVSFSNPLLIC